MGEIELFGEVEIYEGESNKISTKKQNEGLKTDIINLTKILDCLEIKNDKQNATVESSVFAIFGALGIGYSFFCDNFTGVTAFGALTAVAIYWAAKNHAQGKQNLNKLKHIAEQLSAENKVDIALPVKEIKNIRDNLCKQIK